MNTQADKTQHILPWPVSCPSILPAPPLTDTRSVFWTPVLLISPPASLAPCRADCWTYRCSSPRLPPPSRLRTPSLPRPLPERPGVRWSPPTLGWFGLSFGGPCWSVHAIRAGPPSLPACERGTDAGGGEEEWGVKNGERTLSAAQPSGFLTVDCLYILQPGTAARAAAWTTDRTALTSP